MNCPHVFALAYLMPREPRQDWICRHLRPRVLRFQPAARDEEIVMRRRISAPRFIFAAMLRTVRST